MYDNFPFDSEAKMEKNVWAKKSLGLPGQHCPHPPNTTREKENQPSVQTSAPLLSPSFSHTCPLPHSSSPGSQMQPVPPIKPRLCTRSHPCRNVCPSLPSDFTLPSRRCSKAALKPGLLPLKIPHPYSSLSYAPPLWP